MDHPLRHQAGPTPNKCQAFVSPLRGLDTIFRTLLQGSAALHPGLNCYALRAVAIPAWAGFRGPYPGMTGPGFVLYPFDPVIRVLKS